MEITGTKFDNFRNVNDNNKKDWGSHVTLFMTEIGELYDDQKREYRIIFDWIGDDNWNKIMNSNDIPSNVLGEELVEKFVNQCKIMYKNLATINYNIDSLKPDTYTGSDYNIEQLLLLFELPSDVGINGLKFMAKYFVDNLILKNDDRKCILPLSLFRMDNKLVTIEKFKENVRRLLEAEENGNVKSVAKQINVSSDKLIMLRETVKQGANDKSNGDHDVPETSPRSSASVNDEYIPDDPTSEPVLLEFDTDFGIETTDFINDNEIIFEDTGFKSLALAVMVVFPGLLNSLLLEPKYHRNFFMNGHKILDVVSAKEISQLAKKIERGDLKDGKQITNAISALFISTCYKLLAMHRNSLFSYKRFTDSRLFLIDMVLIYFGVGIIIDGHVVGDETNIFSDKINLENGNIMIMRHPFPRAIKGLFQTYYTFNKIQTGRFYHYYDIRGKWGEGRNFFETKFWNSIISKNVRVGDMGQKCLRAYYS
jgi:hypothetical protein